MILDLSFELKVNKSGLKSVKDSSNKALSPHEAMYELGNVIPQIIWAIATSPDTGEHILFSKIDFKDGYWRMVVKSHKSCIFAYVLLPIHPTDPSELVVPDALHMEWYCPNQ